MWMRHSGNLLCCKPFSVFSRPFPSPAVMAHIARIHTNPNAFNVNYNVCKLSLQQQEKHGLCLWIKNCSFSGCGFFGSKASAFAPVYVWICSYGMVHGDLYSNCWLFSFSSFFSFCAPSQPKISVPLRACLCLHVYKFARNRMIANPFIATKKKTI